MHEKAGTQAPLRSSAADLSHPIAYQQSSLKSSCSAHPPILQHASVPILIPLRGAERCAVAEAARDLDSIGEPKAPDQGAICVAHSNPRLHLYLASILCCTDRARGGAILEEGRGEDVTRPGSQATDSSRSSH